MWSNTTGTLLHNIGITTTSALGALALSLVGLANIFGTLAAGYLGNFYQKIFTFLDIPWTNFNRAIFILMPITANSYHFLRYHGFSLACNCSPNEWINRPYIWFEYMGTLYGIVFFSHQLGSFLGVWLGGRMYDTFGDYTAVWWIGVGVGLSVQ